jgi:LPXTG-motif cell wall-anchored protein
MMLGADYDHHYAYATSRLGADPKSPLTAVPATANIGTRRPTDMLKFINYYYVTCNYDINTAIAKAITNYDKDNVVVAGINKTGAQLLQEIPDAIKSGSLSNFVLALQGKSPGMTAEQALALINAGKETPDKEVDDGEDNMPLILIGGAALVAVALMFATRRK